MKLSGPEDNVRMKRKSDAISFETENILWDSGAFGCSNSQQLIDTLIYNLGLHLALRACSEHRNLEFGENSQITLQTSENGKNHQRIKPLDLKTAEWNQRSLTYIKMKKTQTDVWYACMRNTSNIGPKATVSVARQLFI